MRKMKEVSVVAFVLLLCFVKGSYEACTDTIVGIDATKVATMCTDSVITGTSVYIDTSLATTMTLSAGTVCSCDVQSQHGKSMNVTSLFAGTQGSDCGSTINYASSGLPGSYRNVSCQTEQFELTAEDITINFIKIHTPYDSNYCVSIELDSCTNTEFQCNDGECIPDSERCDSLPHCSDGSDEDNCNYGTCVEGQVLCDDGVTCISPYKWCDGTADCPDASDEPASCGGMTTATPTPSTSSPPVPLVTITCTKSLHAAPTAATGKLNEDNTSGCPDYCIVIIVVCSVLLGIIAAIIFCLWKHVSSSSSDNDNKVAPTDKDLSGAEL